MSRMAQIAGIAIERRSSEDALRNSEVKFRGLFESMMEGVYQTSRERPDPGRQSGLRESHGLRLRRRAVPGTGGRPVLVSERSRNLRAPGRDSKAQLRNEEYVLRRKDGSMLVVMESSRVVRDKHGRVTGYEGTLTDITERKKAETAVFQAKERAQVTLQSIGDAVITTDSEGRIEYMNPVAESLTGWENREAEGRLIGEVLDRGR